MKTIDTLIKDIYALFQDGKIELRPEYVTDFGQRLASKIASRITEVRQEPALRISNIGKPCERQLWFSIKHPEWGEDLPPEVRIKFSFGDILEEYLLFLAKEAGHDVQCEQMEVDLFGVKGHIDAIIDGCLVDCKSASSYSFNRFANHLDGSNDSFGYLGQLGGYVQATRNYPEIKTKNHGAFLVVDKTLGHICLDIHEFPEKNWETYVQKKKNMLEGDIPPKAYAAIPDGKSGNMMLGMECSYCSFKKKCWTGVRTFLYSSGPRYLTRVERLPDVTEV